MSPSPDPDDSAVERRRLAEPIRDLLATARTAEAQVAATLRAVDPAHLASARNLVHYLALRRHDLRELQDRLAAAGLSSLGRAEPCVAATLTSVLRMLALPGEEIPPAPVDVTFAEGRALLDRATDQLLGSGPPGRGVRILVTLPSEAAHDYGLVHDLMASGMDAARINCAHDDAHAWEQMIAHVRRAQAELDRPCRVLMDLAGPKLRTGALPPGPRVVKLKPRRDARGRVLAPAQAWLVANGAVAPAGTIAIPVPTDFLAALAPDDRVQLMDARGSRRRWSVRATSAAGVLVESLKTSYVETGMRLRAGHHEGQVGELPACEQPIVLRPGDALLLTASDEAGAEGPPARISCSLPQVFADVRPGDAIWFDDGAIGGRVTAVSAAALTIEITDAKAHGSALRADKGINLPDTRLSLPPLDDEDQAALAFVAKHADLVGYSFVRRPSDVVALQERLAALGRADLGVILKIETREAFDELPALLLAAMRRPTLGVMIARGDLAVECGWERLAELQEEILWICEAAHVPVIWATQVLEHLAKEGRPSRAEITDAAMSERAECVMLNKGAHVLEAVRVLDDILRRMAGHQSKKRARLRPLALAQRFATAAGTA